jgi:hypothetical protein
MLVVLSAWLTLRDYFGVWANEYIVRFQYHAPTRAVAQLLNQHPEITDVAIGTNPYQLVLDPLALRLDMPHDIAANWFNAEAVVVQPFSGPTIFTALQAPSVEVRQVLSDTAQLQAKYPEFDLYTVHALPANGPAALRDPLTLIDTQTSRQPAKPGQLIQWRTHWLITSDPAQPRLKMFLHVLDDQGEVIIGDDREDLNFATLSNGTSFWQINQRALPDDFPPGQYQVEIGWYNPDTGERLKRADGSDRYLLAPLEVIAP